MMLKTSSNKVNPFLNMMLFTFKKNLGFTAIATLLSLLFSPAYLINVMSHWWEYRNAADIYPFTLELLPAAVIVLAIGATAFGWLLLIINFNFLNNKSASDSYHSLPITRAELFVARMVPSYISALIPLTAGYLGMFGISLMPKADVDTGILLQSYFYTAVLMLLCLLFAMLFILASGCVFDSIVSFLAVNIGVPVIILLVLSLCEDTLFGYNTVSTYSAAQYGTPFGYALYGLYRLTGWQSKETAFTVISFIITLAVIIALFVVCIFLYRRRKSEKAGEAFAFKFMPVIISIIISVIAYFIFGYMFSPERQSLMHIIMGAVGAVLAAVIYNAIIHRGFKKIKNAVILGLCSLVAIAGINVSVAFDIFGYETYVPKSDNLVSASVRYKGAIVTEAEDFEYILDLHNAIINAYKNDELDTDSYESYDDVAEYKYENYQEYIYIYYTLKGGKTVERVYHIKNKLLIPEKTVLVQKGLTKAVKEEFEGIDAKFYTLSGYDEQEFEIELSKEEATALINAYVRDLENIDGNYFISGQTNSVYLNAYSDNQEYSGYYQSISYNENFVNTLEVIGVLDITDRNMLTEE